MTDTPRRIWRELWELLFATNEGGRRRAAGIALLLVFGGLVLLCLDTGPVNDFGCYWLGGWAVRDGVPRQMYATLDAPDANGLYSLNTPSPEWTALSDRHLNGSIVPWAYIYPPYCAVLVAPLTLLPYRAALALWKLANFGAYIWCVALLLSFARPCLTATRLKWVALLTLASPLLARTLILGQVSPLLLLAVIAFFAYLRAGKPVLAGVCLALGAATKISPLLFVVWLLARREYRVVISCFVTLAFLTLLTWGVVGSAPFVLFIRHVFPILSGGTAFQFNIAVVSLGAWGFHLSSPFLAEFLPPDRRLTLYKAAVYGVTGWVSVLLFRRDRTRTGTPDSDGRLCAEFAVVNMVLLLISPITWSHHAMNGLLPMLPVVLFALEYRIRFVPTLAGVAYLLILQTPDLASSLPKNQVGTVVAAAGLFLLWAAGGTALRAMPGKEIH